MSEKKEKWDLFADEHFVDKDSVVREFLKEMYETGYFSGYNDRCAKGWDGYSMGYKAGKKNGKNESYNKGYLAGYNSGNANGKLEAIDAIKEFDRFSGE